MNRHEPMTAAAVSPFSTIEYFDAWLDAFGGARGDIWRSQDGGPVAIAFVRRDLRLGPLRIAAACGASNDHTARYDIVGELKEPAGQLGTMLEALGVSLISFDYLARDSRLLSAVRANDHGLWHHVDYCEDSPCVDCQQPWEQYWISRGTTRQLWARRERKLMERMGAVFHCLDRWEEIEPLLPAVYEVEASGWKGTQGSAIKQNPMTLGFYNRCLRHWAERGWLRLFLLELKGSIIAFQIAALDSGVIYQIKVGYDECHAALSPGQVLQLQLLRWAFANERILAYDMLGGGGKAAANKRKWATDATPLYTLRVFRRSLGGGVAWLRFVVAPQLKAILFPKREARTTPTSDEP